MAGTYNANTYNSALYNAGRTDAGALIRSIISAHTGPHIKAAVGGDPTGSPEDNYGLSFISDFSIEEGSVKKPPSSYFFPDLSARIDAVKSQTDDVTGLLRAIQLKNLPASIFLVSSSPDLPASLIPLLLKDLSGTVFGKLIEKDLLASIFVAVDNLKGKILGIEAPRLGGRVFVQPPGDLGAIIWTPTDLAGLLNVVGFQDLSGDIRGFGFKDLAGRMSGVPSPNISAFLKGFASQEENLPVRIVGRPVGVDQLQATITQSFENTPTGPGSILRARIDSAGDSLAATILGGFIGDPANLKALIKTGGDRDLSAVIELLGAGNLEGFINTRKLIDTVRDLPSFLQPVTPFNLSASLQANTNIKFLAASIEALSATSDLPAFIRVSETFVTAIFNVITLSSRNLRATIGNPSCEGGSAIANLKAAAQAQAAGDITGFIQSFLETNLGAVINTNSTFRAIDFIDVNYFKFRPRKKKLIASDTIAVNYSPFRGTSISAFITATPPESTLAATITATFLPPRVSPNVSTLTSADLNLKEGLNIQQLRLQLEGSLREYFYVNGTEDAFIRDFNEQWRINIRSFVPIAANLFGDFAAARVCRLGNLESFISVDEAVRACIASVIGLDGQRDVGAAVVATGQFTTLAATLEVSDLFGDLKASANRVFPADFGATVTGI